MKLKNLTLAVAVALAVAGCAGNKGIAKNADLSPSDDSIRPKPVSTVFKVPDGTMTIKYNSDGSFLELTSKGVAAIAANNNFSVQDAYKVAKLQALNNIAEFTSTQVNTTRSQKVLSTTIQKSLENTTNGMSEEIVIEDKDFDANGDPILTDNKEIPVKVTKEPNSNSQKIAQVLRENISTSSTALVKGATVSAAKVDHESRTVLVEVTTGVKQIAVANQLRKLSGNN